MDCRHDRIYIFSHENIKKILLSVKNEYNSFTLSITFPPMSQDTKTESQTLNMDSFNPKKAELIELAKKYESVTQIEIVDKTTYEQVHQAQTVFQKARTAIKNTGLEMRESANKYIKDVLAVERDLLSVIVPIEEKLIEKKDAWKKKEEEAKEAERKRQEELVNNRVQELAKYGYVHDLFDLKIMEENDFQMMLDDKKTAFEKDQAEENQRKQNEERRNTRHSTAMQIWMYFDQSRQVFCSYLVTDIFITSEEVTSLDDESFQKIIDSHSEKIKAKQEEQKNAQAELDRKKKEQDDKQAELDKQIADQKKIDDEKKRQADLEAARKQAEKETEDRLKKEADEKKAAEEAEQKAQQAKLAKEKKYKEFLASIWYTAENKDEFTFIDTEKGRVFYKKVWTYEK